MALPFFQTLFKDGSSLQDWEEKLNHLLFWDAQMHP